MVHLYLAAMFSFQHNEYLFGIIILIPLSLLFFYAIYRKEKIKTLIGSTTLVNNLIANYSAKKFRIKFLMICISLVLLVIAAANLRTPVENNNEDRAGVDIIFALDVSKSMWADDVKPSRLEFAKQLMNKLVDKLADNRIGFILFAGKPYLQSPLTVDAGILKMCLSNASPDVVPVQGTILPDALKLCDKSFNSTAKKYKSVILISDGEDHDTHIDDVLRQLYDDGVIVNTVGVGTIGGATITEPGTNIFKTDVNGQTVISKLNDAELKLIASKTGGSYTYLSDNATKVAESIYTQIGDIERKLIKGEGNTKSYLSLFPFFIAIGFLFLVFEIFISETKRIKR